MVLGEKIAGAAQSMTSILSSLTPIVAANALGRAVSESLTRRPELVANQILEV